MNGNDATDLIGTTSSTSFTWLATFGKKHHSPPYGIFCASPRGLHPNVIFPRHSQNPKTLEVHILLKSNLFLIVKAITYNPWKYLSNGVYHVSIGPHFTLALKGFVVGSQISNLIIWLPPLLLIITHANQI